MVGPGRRGILPRRPGFFRSREGIFPRQSGDRRAFVPPKSPFAGGFEDTFPGEFPKAVPGAGPLHRLFPQTR